MSEKRTDATILVITQRLAQQHKAVVIDWDDLPQNLEVVDLNQGARLALTVNENGVEPAMLLPLVDDETKEVMVPLSAFYNMMVPEMVEQMKKMAKRLDILDLGC